LDERMINELGVSANEIEEVVAREWLEMRRREEL